MSPDPTDTFTYWLPADLSKPESERRGLVYRHGSIRFWRQFQADQKHIFRDDTNCDLIDAELLELLSRGLVRCVGFESLDQLQSVDLIQMAGALRRTGWLSELEKKASPSPAPSAPESSATSANLASA